MNHSLKIWPQYYDRLLTGEKTFEIRKNDRGFQAGDSITLAEWDPQIINRMNSKGAIVQEELGYTEKRPLSFIIGYVLPIDAERVVFSLIKPSRGTKIAIKKRQSFL